MSPIIGFNVKLSTDQNNAPAKINFDTIVSNYGNGWNNASHEFVAPVAGFYWFQTTIINGGTTRAAVALIHGSKELQRAESDAHNQHHSSTATAVTKMIRGEKVYVRLLSGTAHKDTYGWPHFVGFLIQQI